MYFLRAFLINNKITAQYNKEYQSVILPSVNSKEPSLNSTEPSFLVWANTWRGKGVYDSLKITVSLDLKLSPQDEVEGVKI